MRRKGGEGGYEGRRLRSKGGSFYGEFFLEGSLGLCREESLSSVVGKG
jgi:hypothetical protein